MNPAIPKPLWSAALLLACVFLFQTGARGQAAEEDELKADLSQVDASKFHTDGQVTVYFKVTDSDGKLNSEITDDEGKKVAIEQKHIQVFEDGKPVEVVDFQGLGSFETRTILVVDASDSMNQLAETGLSKIDATRESCQAFLNVCREIDHVGLIKFSNDVHVLSELRASHDEVKQQIADLKTFERTAWMDALFEALNQLENENGHRAILFLSDGIDNESKLKIDDELQEKILADHSELNELEAHFRQAGIRLEALILKAQELQVPIHTVGFGTADQIDAAALERIAKVTGGTCLIEPNPQSLATLYENTGRAAQEEMAITYKSNNTNPDGLVRRIDIHIEGVGRIGGELREPHFLTITSSVWVFLAFAGFLAIAWATPLAGDFWVRQQEMQARRLAFAPPPVDAAGQSPELVLSVASHPPRIPVYQEKRSVLFRIDAEAKLPASATPRHRPVYCVVLLDLSASMEGERLQAARRALESLVDGLGDYDSFCLIGFSDDATLIVPPSRVGVLRSQIRSRIETLHTSALTRLKPAFEMLHENLPTNDLRKTCVLIVSDGKFDDAASALEASKKVTEARMSAFGIGYDYDHDVLASLCGGKSRVQHLPDAAAAEKAFDNFTRLEGKSISDNTTLHIDLSLGADTDLQASLRSLELIRDARALPAENKPVEIDNLASEPVSLISYIELIPDVSGAYPLGEVTLKCDLPGYGVTTASVTQRIEIEVVSDPSQQGSNPHVVKGSRQIKASRIAEAVEVDVVAGDVQGAVNKLTRLTQQLVEDGETDKADEVKRVTQQLQTEIKPDRDVKDLRGVTRNLTN